MSSYDLTTPAKCEYWLFDGRLLSVEISAELGIDEARNETHAQLAQRLEELQSAAASIGLDPAAVPNWQLNMTEMIKTVSHLVHREDTGDNAATWHGASLLWRLQSGHAHGTFSARVRQIPVLVEKAVTNGELRFRRRGGTR